MVYMPPFVESVRNQTDDLETRLDDLVKAMQKMKEDYERTIANIEELVKQEMDKQLQRLDDSSAVWIEIHQGCQKLEERFQSHPPLCLRGNQLHPPCRFDFSRFFGVSSDACSFV